MKKLQQNKLYYYLQELEFTKQQYPWKLYNAGKGSYFVLTYSLGEKENLLWSGMDLRNVIQMNLQKRSIGFLLLDLILMTPSQNWGTCVKPQRQRQGRTPTHC